MTVPGPETPQASARGVSPWLTHFYDYTGAYLAVWCRLAALGWSAVAGVMAVLLPFFFGWHVAAAALLALVFSAAHAWVGFYHLANPDWKDGADDDGNA